MGPAAARGCSIEGGREALSGLITRCAGLLMDYRKEDAASGLISPVRGCSIEGRDEALSSRGPPAAWDELLEYTEKGKMQLLGTSSRCACC